MDYGVAYTDNRFDECVGRLREIYRAAQEEVAAKLDAHTQKMNAKDREKRAQVQAGKLTEQQYQSWLRGQVFSGRQWQDKVTSITTTLLHANEQATAMVEGDRRAVFGENMLWQSFRLEQDTHAAVSFNLYDSAAVTQLLRDQPNLLPVKTVNGEKDTAWNRRNISNAVAQGIIQGDSVKDIADRIAQKTGSTNENAMVRYARTAMTGAQNAGRLETMREAQDMGIKVKKVWIATLDLRTRPEHADLDGQTVDINEPFENAFGPIMFPGDPNADDANVWNCRCTLGYDYEDSPLENARRYDQEAGVDIDDMDYGEWLEWRNPEIAAERQAQEAQQPAEPTIAGVSRGTPMTHEEADTGRVNPHYGESNGYGINCQSCVPTYEARIRGYDVEVVPNDRQHKACDTLSRNTLLIWKNKDGTPAQFDIGTKWTLKSQWHGETPTAKRFEKMLQSHLEENGRYSLGFKWRSFNAGHIVTIGKENGILRIYDPQSDRTYTGKDVSAYLDRIAYSRSYGGRTFLQWPEVTRMDNKVFDFSMADQIMRKVGEK